MQRVTIIGLGLIGSSIGLALRRWSLERGQGKQVLEVIGFDTDRNKENKAKKVKAVDGTVWDLPSAVRTADLVVLAVPILAMKEVMSDIAAHLPEGCVVTDTGSTKAQVMKWAGEILPPHVAFVGGHPMAGGVSGIDEPSADLLKGATYCIIPSVSASEEAVELVLGFVAAMQADTYFLTTDEHDAFVAAVSHLPLIGSVSLVRMLADSPSWRDMKRLASTGFRDMSRLASGDPIMHRDILLTNRENVAHWVGSYIGVLEELRELILSDEEGTKLENLLAETKVERDKWLHAWETKSFEERPPAPEMPKMGDMMGRMFLGGLAKRKKK